MGRCVDRFERCGSVMWVQFRLKREAFIFLERSEWQSCPADSTIKTVESLGFSQYDRGTALVDGFVLDFLPWTELFHRFPPKDSSILPRSFLCLARTVE